jgi:hypothetical protein
VFFLQLVYLGVLIGLAALYFTDVIRPRHFLGSVPIAVLWYGALGAVLISLTGVFEHNADWLDSWKYWHWARPFVGATVGVVSVLVFQAGILAVGETVDPHRKGQATNLLYYLIAFLVGYREAAFRELVKRLGDVILVPAGSAGGTPTITKVDPQEQRYDKGGPVDVFGTGLSRLQSVKFGQNEATEFGPISDVHFRVTAPIADDPETTNAIVVFRDGTSLSYPFRYTQT